jgi:hypothetical protein
MPRGAVLLFAAALSPAVPRCGGSASGPVVIVNDREFRARAAAIYVASRSSRTIVRTFKREKFRGSIG